MKPEMSFKKKVFDTNLLPPPTQHTPQNAALAAVCPVTVSPSAPSGFPVCRISSRRQQYPAIGKQLFTLSYPCLHPQLSNVSFGVHGVELGGESSLPLSFRCGYTILPWPVFERHGAAMRGERARLEGKVAIVTGAGATGSGDFVGIGQAISILFARNGAKVLLVDRNQQNAEVTLATIKEEGGEASLFVGDVTNNADCQGMAQAAVSRYGKLNVLVNNVGISGPGSVTDVDEDFWDTVIDVNLKSVMLTSRHAIPHMIEVGGGSIVNLSSIVGLRAGSGRPSHPYAASKGGIIGLSNSMAVHYGRNNIRVNCIAPGHIRSPMVARHTSEEMLDLRRRAGPLGTEGTAWDVAWAALFLASDEARWISGVTLPVDAGLLAATPLAMFPYLQERE